MERRVFLEMSPVVSERKISGQELEIVKRRADRDWQWFAMRIAIGIASLLALVSLLVLDNVWVKAASVTLLNIAGLASLYGVYVLWKCYLETRSLHGVNEQSTVLRFFAGSGWTAYNLPAFLAVPRELEVIYPQGLALRSGGSLWRVFRPTRLVVIEELPTVKPGQVRRELTHLESEEIEKQISRYWKQAREGLLLSALCALLVAWEVKRYDGGIPHLTLIVLPIAGIITFSNLWSGATFARQLRRARDAGQVSIERTRDLATEWLAPDRIEWRDGGEPASWRMLAG